MAKDSYIRFRCTDKDKAIIEAMALQDPYANNVSEYLLNLVSDDFKMCHEVEIYGCLYKKDKEVKKEFLGVYLVDNEGRSSIAAYKSMLKKCNELFGEVKYQERYVIQNSEGKECTVKSPMSDFVFLE